jgi:RNA polymerase sigma-54 factor
MPPTTELAFTPALAVRATPALVAFSHALALTSAELDDLVAREVEDNPALELRDDRQPSGAAGDPGALAVQQPNGADALLAELRLLVDARDAAIAEYVVGSLDHHGFCDRDAADIARALAVAPARVERVFAALREAGPPGIGARDVRECLLLQIAQRERADGREHALARTLIADHLEPLARGALGKIAVALGTTSAEVAAARDWIRRTLVPYPAGFTDSCPCAVIPDIVIARGGGVEVHGGGALTISPLYRRLARHDASVRRDVDRATAFVVRLDARRATLRRIAAATAARQRPFLAEEAPAPQPLTRAQIAAELGLHESTISRAVQGKYVQLPCGRVMPFAGFFDAGSPARDALARLVARERRPLSDAELADALRRDGHAVARRTVAKYRGQLGILPHALRG